MVLPQDINDRHYRKYRDTNNGVAVAVTNPDGSLVGGDVTVTLDPTGIASDTNQTNGLQKTQIVDVGGEAVTVTGGKLDVNATASLAGETLPVSGATNGVGVAILDGSGNQITSFGGGTQYTEGDVDTSITGTAAMMEVGSNTLQPVQGTVADGLLVNLGLNNDVTVTGSVTANAGTNLNTSSLALETGGNLAAIKAKTDNIPALGQALAAASVPVILPSATITTLTPPAAITGFATSAKQDTLLTELQLKADLTETQPVSLASVPSHAVTNAGTFAVQVTSAPTTAVTGPLTDTQLRATPVPVTASIDTTGLATTTTDTNTTTIAGDTTSIDAKVPALGQALAAASVPVVLTAAQVTTLTPPAAITGFATAAKQDSLLTELQLKADLTETQPISGTVTANAGTNLNTSTLAVESGGNLAAIKAKTDNIPAQGQALAAGSLPVVLTAAQLTTLTPPAAITGFATAANQLPDGHNVTVDNASLAVTGTFFQATQPVSLASVPSHAVTNAGTFAVQVTSAPSTTVTATDLDVRPLVNTDVVTAELSAVDNAVLDLINTSTASKYITEIGHGVKVVTTAGTDVALAGSTACKKITIQAQTDNTSVIAVGGSGVDATIATGTGIILYPGDVFEMDIDNLADVYIDSLVNGEGVRFTYFT